VKGGETAEFGDVSAKVRGETAYGRGKNAVVDGDRANRRQAH
jgi:hypothetical protein